MDLATNFVYVVIFIKDLTIAERTPSKCLHLLTESRMFYFWLYLIVWKSMPIEYKLNNNIGRFLNILELTYLLLTQ